MFKKLATILVIILLILVVYIGIGYFKHKKTVDTFSRNVTQQLTKDKIANWKQIEEVLKTEIQKQNLLIVLSGQRTIQKTFIDNDKYVADNTNGNPIKFLANKLRQLKTRSITVTATYNFDYAYNMNNLDLQLNDGKAFVKLYYGDLKLRPIAELSDKTVIQTENGILSKDFTPQETYGVMSLVKKFCFNNLINDNEIHKQALENTKTNIFNNAKHFGISDVQFEILGVDTLPNNEVTVINKGDGK
jgi:hypothetical protein